MRTGTRALTTAFIGVAASALLAGCTNTQSDSGSPAATSVPAADKYADDQYTAIGEPENCVSIVNIRNTKVRDNQTIDFEVGSKTYRNRLPYSCPSLGFEEKFSYSTSQSSLCSVDIIHVLYTAGGGLQRGAGCGLGKFQQIERKDMSANAQ